jgi:cation transport protein ChaC
MTDDLSKLSWVFAHGSLMFDAGFEPAHVLSGRAWGWERRFGQPSVRNWGTTDTPAPTSSLSRGSHCDGLLLGLPNGHSGSILASLVEREANQPISLSVSTEFGDVTAFTWLMSDTWAELGVEQLAVRGVANIQAGGGPSGDAWRYAAGVRDTLDDHGLHDGLVSQYVDALQPGAEAGSAPPDSSSRLAPPSA